MSLTPARMRALLQFEARPILPHTEMHVVSILDRRIGRCRVIDDDLWCETHDSMAYRTGLCIVWRLAMWVATDAILYAPPALGGDA